MLMLRNRYKVKLGRAAEREEGKTDANAEGRIAGLAKEDS